MPKVTPTTKCSPENCGSTFLKCGTNSTYRKGCRCESCKQAARARYLEKQDVVRAESKSRYHNNRDSEQLKRRENYRENRGRYLQNAKEYYASNREQILERSRQPEARARARGTYKVWAAKTGKTRIYNASRRAKLKAAFVEHVDHKIVFERDNYVCQNCGVKCPVDAKWPALNAATLDHIVPLSVDGSEHSYNNVQTLCNSCNCAKGNRKID